MWLQYAVNVTPFPNINFCTLTLVLFEVGSQCPVRKFSVFTRCRAFRHVAQVFCEWFWSGASCPYLLVLFCCSTQRTLYFYCKVFVFCCSTQRTLYFYCKVFVFCCSTQRTLYFYCKVFVFCCSTQRTPYFYFKVFVFCCSTKRTLFLL